MRSSRERPGGGRSAPGPAPANAPAESLERLAGQHVVREALRARRRRLVRLLLEDGPPTEEASELASLAAAAGVEVATVPRRRLAELTGAESRSQGALLEAGPLPELPLRDLLAGAPGGRRLVALDGVEDPQNLGAIARVAEAAGAGGLVLTRRRAPPLSPAASRASAGALEHLPVARVTNLPRSLADLRAEGFWSVGAEPDAEADLFSAPDRLLSGDLVVVLGAEGRGLRRGVRAMLDHELRIPMAGRVASLNVSAAAAVVLFELVRRGRTAPTV